MKLLDRCTNWLETHWVNPAYSGWLMIGLAIFFFGAATNTMAGWLYVISGVMVAVLVLAAGLSLQTLRGLRLRRAVIASVSVGQSLRLELIVENHSRHPKTLIQLLDIPPQPLPPIRTAIEQILPQETYHWSAELPTQQRGVYRWQTVQLRTAAPLGLFWCRRSQIAEAKAVVYPTVLNLTQCPLVDEMGQDDHQWVSSYHQAQVATEGVTRTLRPYRWGDSTRLIHWRSSARYGELRVRELETYTGGQELIIGLDSSMSWNAEYFEQAVVAAASLYFYALHRRLQVSLWTARTGLLRGDQPVLEALAATQPQENITADRPRLPLLWLTSTTDGLTTLPASSRWLLWPENKPTAALTPNSYIGVLIQPDQALQPQLQTPVTRSLKGRQ